jgi:Putative zinc-finger
MKLPAQVEITCKQVTEWVSDYLAAPGMANADRARLEQHLHACTWCMDYLHQLQDAARAARALGGDAVELPESDLLTMFRRAKRVLGEVSATQARPLDSSPPGGRASTVEGARYAFKFLMAGGIGPLSRFSWPLPTATAPGEWVEVAGRVEPSRVGVHACRTRELSWWLHDTLWVVELAGLVQSSGGGVVAPRGRLLREVEAWRDGGAMRFAQAAYEHALAQVSAAEPERRAAAMPCVESSSYHLPNRNFTLAAFCAAMAMARLRGITRFVQSGYDAERRWQSAWIARELNLPALLPGAAAR